jgi:WD40 repeat protein
MSLLAPVTHAITISAEVRGDAVFVEGSDAGRKQPIYWDYDGPDSGLPPINVTTTNPKGKFSFEVDSPEGCPPDNCVGWLTVGDDPPISVDIAYEPTETEYCLLEDAGEQPNPHGGDAVRAVGFVADDQVVSGGADAYLRYWDLPPDYAYANEPLYNIPYDLDVNIPYDPDVPSIIATGEGGWNGHAGSETLLIWDASGELLTATQPLIGFVYSVVVSPVTVPPDTGYANYYWVAASGFYGDIVLYQLTIYDPSDSDATDYLELYSTTDTRKKRTTALDISSNASLLASASTGGIQLWEFPGDCATGNCVLNLRRTLNHPSSWSASIAFAPDSEPGLIKIVSGTDSGEIKFWIINNLAEENELVSVRSADSGSVYSIAFSNDTEGTMIVAGGNGDITVYDPDLNILFRKEDAHAGRVNDVAFSPNNSLIVSGGADGALKLWSLPQCE